VFNATFNNILAILWRSVLLGKETADLTQFTEKNVSHNDASNTPRHERGLELTILVVIGVSERVIVV
jgi:hypothetical protein